LRVDGDTIHALLDGVDENVRIIGPTAPRRSGPGRPSSASRRRLAAAKRLLAPGDPIVLRSIPPGHRDRYDRLLAHVFLPTARCSPRR
jgi:endonuclease YncB( thermonuclease family)